MYAFNVGGGASEMQLVTFGKKYETSTPKPVIKGRTCMINEVLVRIL
jgi:hypothetical protein